MVQRRWFIMLTCVTLALALAAVAPAATLTLAVDKQAILQQVMAGLHTVGWPSAPPMPLRG